MNFVKTNGRVRRPVFIIGCPRSGTSITLQLLSAHEQWAWCSDKMRREPHRPQLSLLNRIYDMPGMGKYLYLNRGMFRKVLPAPMEARRFMASHLSNFEWKKNGNIPRRHSEEDMSGDEVERIHHVFSAVCASQRKNRLLLKYTDFSRIRYLLKAFPDAQFIHVVRDGRAVANSYCNKIRTGVFGTWDEREWWMKGWPKRWQRQWKEKFHCPLGFVTYQWKYFVDEIWEEAKHLPAGRYLQVNYRDIMDSPAGTLADIFEFCGLAPSGRVQWHIERAKIQNRNDKWRKELNDREKQMLEEIITERRFRRLLDKQ